MSNDTRIVELRVENVKKIKAVRIRPEDGAALIEITGRNGQGKTSILDAITYALGGKDAQPAKPVRDGADCAAVVVETNEYVIERTWTGDKTVLNVRNKEGAKYGSPQALLDAIVGDLSFDPLAFSRMKPADQVKTLKDLAGLDFDQIDSLRAGTFEDRTMVNREHKTVVARLAAMPQIDAPDEEVSIAELSAAHQQANATILENMNRRNAIDRRLADIRIDLNNRHTAFTEHDSKIRALEMELAKLKTAHDEMRQANLAAETEGEAETKRLEIERSALADPDVAALADRLQNAEGINASVRAKKERKALEEKMFELKNQADMLTARLNDLDNQKEEMLRSAKLPIDGLSVTEGGITLNGIPFDQASSGEQLRVSVAMGLALNPRLKVMLVRDGSLLDSEGRKLLASMAEAAQAQVWMERATDGEPVGIVIEDGEIKEAAGEVHVDH